MLFGFPFTLYTAEAATRDDNKKLNCVGIMFCVSNIYTQVCSYLLLLLSIAITKQMSYLYHYYVDPPF